MSRKVCSFNASFLRINDGAPVKISFLSAEKEGHFVGFYSIADGAFYDVRTLFANAGAEVLIPGVSSVFLGSRLNGKTPVFFVIENGFTLNKDAEWFQDAVAGHGGFWKFLKPASRPELIPALSQGKIVWQKEDGIVVEAAQSADSETTSPVLVWQSSGGRVFSVKGTVFRSVECSQAANINPDRQYRYLVTPQEDGASVVLDFVDTAAQKTELSFNVYLGKRNLDALMRNRVVGALSDWPRIQDSVLSATVEIPDEFEDTLYLEGFENQGTIPVAGVTFLIEGADTNHVTIKGEAPVAIYEELLSCMKIRTAASADAKSDVYIVFRTKKEEIAVDGKTDILSEKVQTSPLLTGFSPVKANSEEKTVFPASLFGESMPAYSEKKNQVDDLPSFLTQPISTPVTAKIPANGKTVLITGGACKRGGAIAHAFASCGYNVIVHCHTAAAQATHLVEELQQKYGIKAAYFRADFNSYEETADLIPSITKTYGPIDVLVCHAFSFVKEETENGWNQNMAVNLRAPFVLMRSFALGLPKGREGTVVSVFSQSLHELSSYALASFSMPGLTTLAAETYKNKIKVCGLSVVGLPTDDSQIRKIAETVLFLAENQVVSGQTLKIDILGSTEKKTSLF